MEALDGSSYRKSGVRMSIQRNGKMIGAVSGGCVEKEVLRQAESVFATNLPKLMVYDGRYRLGCERVLYILIEPFDPDNPFFEVFEEQCNSRTAFKISTCFSKEKAQKNMGVSTFHFNRKSYPLHPTAFDKDALDLFEQTIAPEFNNYCGCRTRCC